MKFIKPLVFLLTVLLISVFLVSCADKPAVVEEGEANLTDAARECVECHTTETHGIVADWDNSRHAEEGISCIDCHEVNPDSPMALSGVEGHENLEVAVSMLIPPSVCGECHEDQVAQFNASGHYRAHIQRIPKAGLTALVEVHEGQNHPEFKTASDETGCMLCHGTTLIVDETGHPTAETYPNPGIGSVYPNGEIGNCVVCHTRHAFEKAEARKPQACASCHLGPDHPDIEIYENTKHGQIYDTEGGDWIWDRPYGEWEPGDYRAPTCATCHMSGIGDLEPTHNITQRLYWNLWTPESKVRNSDDVLSPWLGDGEAGRVEMMQVCSSCHSSTHTATYFESGDKAVKLYNESYWQPVEAMRVELEEAGLLKENPWNDEFQILHYYIWHHEGRRARQGAMMGGPDWAHWHGFFQLQQKIYRATEIYELRMENGVIEEFGTYVDKDE